MTARRSMLDVGMAVFTSEALSRADATWLHAESPTNHFVVTSLAILDAAPDVSRLKAMLKNRIALHPRLGQVVAEPMLPLEAARWVRAPNFDLDAHIHRIALPAPAGHRQLVELIADLVGQPLDFGRPLWAIYAIDGPDGGGAIVGRFHHSLGDGQAMVRMLLTMTDETASGWRQKPHRARTLPLRRLRDGRNGLARLIDMLPAAPRLARTTIEGGGTLARLTLLDPDRPTRLRGPLGLLKAVAWSDPIAIARVKKVARTYGTTINDVVVSAIAGGLGAYLRRNGTDTRGLRIRAMVPVNLRPVDDVGMTGNRFSLVFLELPIGVTDALERLMRTKHEMDRIKASLEPAIGWLLVQGLGFLPAPLEHLTSSFYAAKASLVLTNVIGPRRIRYLAGRRIKQMTFWEPESGGLGVGISIYSYAGEVTIGVVSDRNLVPDPELLTDDVMREFRRLTEQL